MGTIAAINQAVLENLLAMLDNGSVATIKRKLFVATSAQTLFVLTGGSYVSGNNHLDVYVDGKKRAVSVTDIVETSATSFTVTGGVSVGLSVEAIWIEGVQLSTLENARAAAETLRVAAELLRVTAESGRVTAETNRGTAETSRVSRDTAFQLIEAYNNSGSYVPLNKVTLSGNTYQCLLATTGNTPPNATYWILTAQAGSVTSVTSANADIAVATGSTSPVLTLNSGVGANKIVKRNIDGYIDDVVTLSADTTQNFVDLMVNVRDHKTAVNTWNEALQAAVVYANTIHTSVSETGGLYVPSNALVKMPRGRYTITTAIVGAQGLDFDFTGAVFVASPTDKTIDFLDLTDKCFRNEYTKGSFIGFKKAFIVSTNNIDTAKIIFNNPTFQSCQYGIDTISHAKARSTFLKVVDIYSIKTDQPIKTHTDMCYISGGWIYHSGYNGAAIYNQGFTTMDNVICVPLAAGTTSRWIDNYSEDAGSTTILGQRGLHINHCRFGGEGGSMPIVYNYASVLTAYANYAPTNIVIENTQATATGQTIDALIVLFAMPNRIEFRNMSGMTNLANGLIYCDASFNSTLLANSKLISIELDDSCYYSTNFPLMTTDLKRFLKTKENPHTMFRDTFTEGRVGLFTGVAAAAGSFKVTLKIKTPTDYAAAAYQQQIGSTFLCTISSSEDSGSYGYKENSVYIISVTGGYSDSAKKRLNYTLLASHLGGIYFADDCLITSVHWGTANTGSADQDVGGTEESVTIVFNGVTNARVAILPLWGVASNNE